MNLVRMETKQMFFHVIQASNLVFVMESEDRG